MDTEQLEKQVQLYLDSELDAYKAFEALLKAVLGYGAKKLTYNPTVGARVKGPASFAEKCIRKQGKYTTPVYELTDLCGARVVVNTLDEVERLCAFVERHFVVDWPNSEDKLDILRASEFSYRSVHYVVQVDPSRLTDIAIAPEQLAEWIAKINAPQHGENVPFQRKAEIQLRTCMQHVWADTLHDRTYKSGIQIPKALLRESHRIAALLDKADEDLLHLNDQIDAYAKDYASHLTPGSLRKELGIVGSLVEQKGLDPKDKGDQVLRLLGLRASARQWTEIVGAAHLRGVHDSRAFLDEFDRLQALATCRVHAEQPRSDAFVQGLKTLERLARPVAMDKAIRNDVGARLDFISEALAEAVDGHGRVRRDPARSRTMADLAWARLRDTADPAHRKIACETMFQAHLLDPSNPYVFGDQIWLQLESSSSRDFLRYAWTAIEDAMERCRSHLAVGLDRNRGWATLGRFHLLRSEWSEAGQAYARLIASATSAEILSDEWSLLASSARALEDTPVGPHIGLLVRTLKVAALLHGRETSSVDGAVLVVAGTCSPTKAAEIDPFRAAIVDGVRAFRGLVISGGTPTGVAGMAGEAFVQPSDGSRLLGCVPRRGSSSLATHPSYTEFLEGELPDFGIESVVQYWEKIVSDGRIPSQVRVLGAGGGPIARFEYDLALALGASVGLVRGSGREADRLLGEDPWWENGHLADLFDDESIVLFCAHAPTESVDNGSLFDRMAALAHDSYLAGFGVLPENLRPWKVLDAKYKSANLDQASAVPLMLGRFGLEIHPLDAAPAGAKRVDDLAAFLGDDGVVALARMEHARWSLERGRSGWRHAKERDNGRKLHPNLVPWKRLSDGDRDKDLAAVKAWVSSLEACGCGIYASA